MPWSAVSNTAREKYVINCRPRALDMSHEGRASWLAATTANAVACNGRAAEPQSWSGDCAGAAGRVSGGGGYIAVLMDDVVYTEEDGK